MAQDKPLNIAYLTDTFLPDVSGGAVRAFNQAEFLSKKGYHVTVFSNVKPGNFSWKMVECKGKSLWQIFPNAGYIPSYVRNVKRQHMNKKFDFIFASMPSFAIGASALWLSKAMKIPFVIEVRDPFVRPFDVDKKDTAYVGKKSWKGKILFKLQNKIFTKAKRIIVTNPSIRDEIQNMHHIPASKFSVVYNSPNLEQFKNIDVKKFNSFTILYAGRILPSKSLQDVLLSLKETDAKLAVCGEGNTGFLTALAQKEKLENKLEILGRMSHDETLQYLMGANVLFVGLDDKKTLEYALPSKVFEYMAAGKPILSVGSPNGDLAQILKKTNAGIHCSKSQQEIGEALKKLKENYSFYSQNSLKAVQGEFNTEVQLNQLLHSIQGIGEEKA